MNVYNFCCLICFESMIFCSQNLQNSQKNEEKIYFQVVGIRVEDEKLHESPNFQEHIVDSETLELFFDYDFWEFIEVAKKEQKILIQVLIDWELKQRNKILHEENYFYVRMNNLYLNFKWKTKFIQNRPKTPFPEWPIIKDL